MESLLKVASGDSNVAIGISGFGSAKVGRDRWEDLARLTGRTTYYLQYDAQELPWPSGSDIVWTPSIYRDVMRRWEVARQGARVASKYLADWLVRLSRSGKNILIVGFSLGAYVAWQAVRQVPDDLKANIEVIMLSAAVPDRHDTWTGMEHLRRVINAFSYDDLVLKYLYPRAVGDDETPAAGLGPIVVPFSNVENLDLTDMIGRDHLWGSSNIMRLVRVSLGRLWGGDGRDIDCSAFVSCSDEKCLSSDSVQRLYRWVFIDPVLWRHLDRAIQGDPGSVSLMSRLDKWSIGEGRLSALIDAGATVASLEHARMQPMTARRSQDILRGLLRHWLHESPELLQGP